MSDTKKPHNGQISNITSGAGILSAGAAWLTTPSLMTGALKGFIGAVMIGSFSAIGAMVGLVAGGILLSHTARAVSMPFTKSPKIREDFLKAGGYAGAFAGGLIGGIQGHYTAHDIVVNGMDNDPTPEVRTEAPSAKVPESMRENFSKATDRKTGATYYLPPKLTMNTAQFKMQS
ncbi:MAG: hypothetical protein ACQEQL_07370 [Pseudomonadota bacterium]